MVSCYDFGLGLDIIALTLTVSGLGLDLLGYGFDGVGFVYVTGFYIISYHTTFAMAPINQSSAAPHTTKTIVVHNIVINYK